MSGIRTSSDFNYPLHAGPVSRDSSHLFITHTPERGPAHHRKLEEIIPQISRIDQNSGIEELITNTPENFVSDPYWHSESRRLYFAADFEGGSGQLDIYYMQNSGDGQWSLPVNLGSDINTFGIERSPFVHRDTLYFASDGLGGLGGLDIYFIPISSDRDKKPVNMGVPYNSNKDDFFFFIDESEEAMHFLSSDRDGGMGMDDIYYIQRLPDNLIRRIIVMVKDAESGFPLRDIGVELQKKNPGTFQTLITEENGATGFFVTEADTLINLNVYGQDYLNYDVRDLSIVGVDTILVELQRLRLNTPMVLKDIHYDFDRFTIRPQESESVFKLATILHDNPALNVELRSHADSRGTVSYNQKLSERRSKSVVDYLVRLGISSDRISAKSYGKSYPLNDCGKTCSEFEHQLNRRTEIVFYHGGFEPKPYEYPLLDMNNGNKVELRSVAPKNKRDTVDTVSPHSSDASEMQKQREEEPTKTAFSGETGGFYYLIAGSFASAVSADEYAASLRKKLGQDEIVILPPFDKVNRYRVAVGKFENHKEASLKLKYYQEKLDREDVWILSLPNQKLD